MKRWLGTGLILGLLALVGCRGPLTQPDRPLLETVRARQLLVAGVKYDSRPFGYLDTDGQVKGFDVDLIRLIAGRLLGRETAVEFRPVLSSTRILAIQSGELDVVAATMTITPQRAEIVDFSDPYFTAGQGLLVPFASSVRSLKDLAGQRVLFILGTTSEARLKAKLPSVKTIGYKTATDAFAALKAHRGEALTTDDTILHGLLASDPCAFRLLPERLSEEPYGLAFQKDPEHRRTESLRQRVNALLKEFRADGTLERLRRKWVGLGDPAVCGQTAQARRPVAWGR